MTKLTIEELTSEGNKKLNNAFNSCIDKGYFTKLKNGKFKINKELCEKRLAEYKAMGLKEQDIPKYIAPYIRGEE